MSTLNGQSVSSTYQMLLKTNSATGVSSVLTNVEDGKGNASSLYISNVSFCSMVIVFSILKPSSERPPI